MYMYLVNKLSLSLRRAHSPQEQTRRSGVPGQTNGRTRDLDEHTVRQRQYQDE